MSIWFIARANTLVQMEIDPAMRGRVMGIWNMALPGTSLVTAPMVGWVIDTVGPREGFGLAGVALFVTAVLGWRSLVRPVEAPAATGQGASPGADLVGEWPTAGGSSGQP
jgi:sugar phosphate permease